MLTTIAIFHQDLAIIVNETLKNELMSYMIAIPFLLVYILYRKRKMLRAVIPLETANQPQGIKHTTTIIGVLISTISVLLYWYGSNTFTPLEFHMLALPIFVTGCTLIMFNTRTLRQLIFPILFLFFLVPLPLVTVYQAAATLSVSSSQLAYSVLKTLGLPVRLASQYGTPNIILQKTGYELTFAVDMACSGIYSLIGFFIFAVFITYIARANVWKKALIFAIGFPLIYILNVLRIIIIILIGNYSGMELATEIFHLLGGWVLVFIGTLLLLAVSEKLFKIQLFTAKAESESCNYCNRNQQNKQHFCFACGKLLNPLKIKLSKRDLSKVLVLAITGIIIINLQVPVFALTQGPVGVTIQNMGSEQTVTQILPEIPGYTAEFVYRDERFEEIAQQDASLTYAYVPSDKSEKTVWVTLEIAETKSSLHGWLFCLVTLPQTQGSQPKVTVLSQMEVQLLQDPYVTALYLAFWDSDANRTQAVLYWHEKALFNTGSSIKQKYVETSLITFPTDQENISDVKYQLLPFGQAIAEYWQPIKAWSLLSLSISKYVFSLIATMITLLVALLVFRAVKNEFGKRANLRAYKKLASEDEKSLLQSVYQASQETYSTGNNIASYYQKITGNSIELDLLSEKLDYVEKAGLLEMDIISRQDEPIIVWKTPTSFSR